MKIYNIKIWTKTASVRTIKTVDQAAVASLGMAAVLNEVLWTMIVSASVLTGVVSLLISMAGLPEFNIKED